MLSCEVERLQRGREYMSGKEWRAVTAICVGGVGMGLATGISLQLQGSHWLLACGSVPTSVSMCVCVFMKTDMRRRLRLAVGSFGGAAVALAFLASHIAMSSTTRQALPLVDPIEAFWNLIVSVVGTTVGVWIASWTDAGAR